MLKKIPSLGMGGSEPPHRCLVSDGLYFGQGPLEEFQQDPKAGPVIAATLALLNAIVDQATGKGEAAQP